MSHDYDYVQRLGVVCMYVCMYSLESLETINKESKFYFLICHLPLNFLEREERELMKGGKGK